MQWIMFKYAITAGMVVLISEIAKRSDKLGGLIAALPLVTFLTLIWLFMENQSSEKIANHAWYTFWYVVPTLPMFLAFPWLLKRFNFWSTMGVSVVLTLVSFICSLSLLKAGELSCYKRQKCVKGVRLKMDCLEASNCLV
jgi:F0F1-type ATP synthase assembly protein I